MTASDSTEFLTLPQAAAHLGHGGKKPSTVTLWRWCRRGCRGVTLAYSRFGREIRVTPEALAAFGAAMAAADPELPTPPPAAAPVSPRPKPTRTEAQRKRDIAEAEAEVSRPIR
jgi:hypothetical protein